MTDYSSAGYLLVICASDSRGGAGLQAALAQAAIAGCECRSVVVGVTAAGAIVVVTGVAAAAIAAGAVASVTGVAAVAIAASVAADVAGHV